MRETTTMKLIAIEDLVHDHEYNIRDELDMEHVMMFANAYAKGLEVPPIYVIKKDDEYHVRDGFHRVAGFKEAINQGLDELTQMEARIFKGTDAECLMFMVGSSQGKPLTFLEKAEAYQLLNTDYKMNSASISRKMGVSHTDVNNKLALAQANPLLKDMVREKEVSATQAIEYINKHGIEAYERLKFDLEKALKAGQTKVTAANKSDKGFTPAMAKEVVKLVADGLEYQHIIGKLNDLNGDVDLVLTLDSESIKDLIMLLDDYLEMP